MHRKKHWYYILVILIIAVLSSSTITEVAANDGFILYTVREGDTLAEIAQTYHTTTDEILRENSMTQNSSVSVGDVLKIKAAEPNQNTDDKHIRSGITFDMRDADVRDVLSMLALAMKKNIIYTESPVRVTLSVQNVTAETALELLTQSIGLSYVSDDDMILVGSNANIHQNYYNMMPITRFSLSYLKPEVISAQVDELKIPVQQIILDSTEKYIWAQGTPKALAKMRELIVALDRADNIDPETNEPVSEFKLIPIELQYVKSNVLNTLIHQLEIPCKTILFETNPATIWVKADESAMKDLLELVQSVDIIENKVPDVLEEEAEEVIDNTRIEAKKMMNITSARLLPLIQDLDIPVKVIAIDSSGYNIWMRGDQESINLMNDLINQLDNFFSRDDVNFFIFSLINIKASTALEKLEFIGLQNVRAMSLNYPEFSRELLISCPSDRINDVKNVLRKLDVPGEKIRAVVDSSAASSAKTRLEKRRDLIVQLTGIPRESFTVSDNVSKTTEPLYVLWVEETPDNIALIRDIIRSIDGN